MNYVIQNPQTIWILNFDLSNEERLELIDEFMNQYMLKGLEKGIWFKNIQDL